MRIYIAAPFFTPPQLELVRYIEDTLGWCKVAYPERKVHPVSPRLLNGTITQMSREERLKMSPKIFQSNVDEIDMCNLMLAVVDDRDPGVMWEMGYAYRMDTAPIVSYTDKGYGLNVMVKECVACHVHGRDKLADFLTMMMDQGIDACREKFSNFDPAAS